MNQLKDRLKDLIKDRIKDRVVGEEDDLDWQYVDQIRDEFRARFVGQLSDQVKDQFTVRLQRLLPYALRGTMQTGHEKHIGDIGRWMAVNGRRAFRSEHWITNKAIAFI